MQVQQRTEDDRAIFPVYLPALWKESVPPCAYWVRIKKVG